MHIEGYSGFFDGGRFGSSSFNVARSIAGGPTRANVGYQCGSGHRGSSRRGARGSGIDRPKRFAPTCAFSRSTYSKAAAQARAGRAGGRVYRHAVCARRLSPPGTTAPIFSAFRFTRCTPSKTKPNSVFVPAAGAPVDLAYGSEIVVKDQTGQPTADIDAPIVYVGYGIHAPEYNWNDYAGDGHIST